tara:strand:- start:22285 stop:22425 length:141 start_codon:yes stop_codon:yes gene_type:complete
MENLADAGVETAQVGHGEIYSIIIRNKSAFYRLARVLARIIQINIG